MSTESTTARSVRAYSTTDSGKNDAPNGSRTYPRSFVHRLSVQSFVEVVSDLWSLFKQLKEET